MRQPNPRLCRTGPYGGWGHRRGFSRRDAENIHWRKPHVLRPVSANAHTRNTAECELKLLSGIDRCSADSDAVRRGLEFAHL
jgi:hypothetical protein